MNQTYSSPINQLLAIGEPVGPWPDYPALYGLTQADIPELIRLVSDRELRWQDVSADKDEEADKTEWWAQIHAWRALAQLHAVEAIPALIGILDQIEDMDDEWWSEESEDVFVLLGPASIEPLSAYLAATPRLPYTCCSVGEALEQIATHYPETRPQCLQALVAALQDYQNNDESLNAFLIINLIALKAVEQIDLIEQAYLAGKVDEMVNGDFEDVQVEMGLLEKRRTPARNYFQAKLAAPKSEGERDPMVAQQRKTEKKEKAKRKQEKQSRKKNRKKRK